MRLLNFSHPLTDEQLGAIEEAVGIPVSERLARTLHLDHARPFEEQLRAAVAQVPLSAEAWQREPLVVVLPGYAPAAALLMAELHGRMGHFPTVVRLRPIAGSTPTRYEVAELINLQAVRDRARVARQNDQATRYERE